MIIKEPAFELRLGDCLDPATGLASLESVDHVITDPPYGEEAHTLQRRFKRQGVSGAASGAVDRRLLENGSLNFSSLDFASLDFASRQFARIAKRWVVVFCQVEQTHDWRTQMKQYGLDYVRTGVWIKPDGQPQYTGDRPGMGYESLVICHPPGRKKWNGGGRHGVWRFNKIGPEDVDRTGHQTQKPMLLMEKLVSDFSSPGDLICDPFMGSGTTGVACIKLGRRFIGWEKDPKYFEIARKRIGKAREQLQLFGAA